MKSSNVLVVGGAYGTDVTEIGGSESALVDFPGEFDDFFDRSEPREHLRNYLSGHLADG